MMADKTSELVVGLSLLPTVHGEWTGTATYVRELLRHLGVVSESARFDVLCNEHTIGPAREWSRGAVRLHQAEGFRAGKTAAARLTALAKAALRPSPLSRQFDPEMQVVHYPLTLRLPRVSQPTVMTIYDLIHHDHPEFFTRPERVWRALSYDRPAKHATLVITLSRHARGRIIDQLGVDESRVVSIPWAADDERFSPQAAGDDDEIAAPLDLPERFLFYPASLWVHKNHAKLLAALGGIDDEDLHLVLTGATYDREDELLWAPAREHGVEERVHHLGFVEERALPVLYRRATAMVFPSLYEGFGTPPLEAMASGCPVASTTEASLADVCGDAVVRLDPEDPDQMATAIAELAGDEALQQRYRAEGLEQAKKFSWARCAEGHIDAYRHALELGPR